MNCIYLPELSKSLNGFPITTEELKHIKALRIGTFEKLLATNGKGLSAIGKISIDSKKPLFNPEEFFENTGENNFKSGLALGILDNKDRFEFALEKAVELGINDFFPLISEFTQRKTVNIDRLKSKAISSMKQCCRSFLPLIHEPVTIEELNNQSISYERVVLADINGKKFESFEQEISTLVIVGPEGGFSNNEIEKIDNDKRLIKLNLGNRRLRAETAAIVALGKLS
ncbi:MAG: 16S rRNA (uracil(1498)-N(3))-methyltransferase [Ignavibacteriae bacterium]|nr:16S rRNA (uracil(1498)-N(3))-methyltransferase [Ignavibacteriota bacterium]